MDMSIANHGARLALILSVAVCASAAEKKEFRYTVGPGASISITNPSGPVTLRPSSGGQVIISANPASDKVEVHSDRSGNRIEVRSHALSKASQDEMRVEYEVLVPPDANVSVRSGAGAINAQKLRGDLTLESDAGKVEVSDSADSHVHVRTANAPITLTDVRNGHVEIWTVGGDVNLTNVSGSKVAVNTTSGKVRYDGGFTVPGEYSVTTHSGDIEVAMPEKASVDITAQSVKGSVEDGFRFQPQPHPTISVAQGRSFAGTSNSGEAAVRLRSFSGKIKVTKK